MSNDESPSPATVRETRLSLGLTQPEAAALLGVDRVTWARYEGGTRAMTTVQWQYFLHVAGIDKIPYHRRRSSPIGTS